MKYNNSLQLFEGKIPQMQEGRILFKIYANDTLNNFSTSKIYTYQVKNSNSSKNKYNFALYLILGISLTASFFIRVLKPWICKHKKQNLLEK